MPPTCSQSPLTDETRWDPNHCAVSRTSAPHGDAPGRRRIFVLRHPAYPFQRRIRASDEKELARGLIKLAVDYLDKVRSLAGIPDSWVELLRKPRRNPQTTFDWLPIQWGLDPAHAPGGKTDPRYSFWVERHPDVTAPPGRASDRTLVLLASYVFIDKAGVTRSLGSEQGLRIVIQVRSAAGNHNARITSLSAAFFASDQKLRPQQWEEIDARIKSVQSEIARALVLRDADEDPWPIRFRGLGVSPSGVQLFGSGVSALDIGAAPKAYDFIATVRVKGPVEFELHETGKSARQSHASDKVVTHLFTRDPASAGPPETIRHRRRRRGNDQLNAFRVAADLPPLKGRPGWAGHAKLVRAGLFDVRQSPFVDQALKAPPMVSSDREPSDPAQPETIATKRPFPPRASAVDAAQAYYHGWNLFGRLIAFNLDPATYFKLAKLPLLLRFRSGVAPGPGSDGQTVNAQVEFFPGDPDFRVEVPLEDRPSLEVEFALGDLKRRDRPVLDHRGIFRRHPRAAYLGIGADPRWAWHEFGHVLLGAGTGELELRFAHSVGDALAAINADPTSELSVAPGWRGVTYPWIGSIRRHDRDVRLGWSWSGSFHRATRLADDRLRANRKAYVSEQILSTTLFGLYRSLGGDTVKAVKRASAPDRDARQAAADYVVYLIMRAVQLLGPVSAVPAEIVEQFVTALVDADAGTGEWKVLAKWPYERGKPARRLVRLRGCVHKVIRWAFEAQGHYAADPVAIVNAPGEPPAVDLYLDDRRPDSQGKHPRGGYMPVSLHWALGVGAAAPAWHASDTAIDYDAARGRIWLTVNNRGAVEALNVTAKVWYRVANSSTAPWKALSSNAAQPAKVPASVHGVDGAARFGPFAFKPAPGTTYLVAALGTCPADSANSAGPDGTPLWKNVSLLRDLVAHDNNIGLRVIDVK